MSVCFVRFFHNLPNRTAPRKFLPITNVQTNRNYHFRNTIPVHNLTRQCAATSYLNVRYSSLLSSIMESLTWQNYTDRLNKVVSTYSESDIVLTATEKMVQFHDLIGLPWWSCIVLSTIAMRTLIFPFAIHQQYVNAKYEQVLHEMNTTVKNEVTQKMKALAMGNDWNQNTLSSAYMDELKNKKKELVRKYNCHPFKLIILLLLQVPIWTTSSCVLRNLTYMQPFADATAQIVHAEMKLNSFLWMYDLTAPDMYLPLVLTITNMINVQFTIITRRNKPRFVDKVLRILHVSFCIILCTFAIDVPSSIVLYWTTSSLCGLIQNLVLLSPKVRKRLRIPTTASMRPKPYQKIINKYKNFYKFLKY